MNDTITRAVTAIRREKSVEVDLGRISAQDYATWASIADWLESVAGACASPDEDVPHAGRMIANVDELAAVTIARAYLEDAS